VNRGQCVTRRQGRELLRPIIEKNQNKKSRAASCAPLDPRIAAYIPL
jgi:hypothetical protein